MIKRWHLVVIFIFVFNISSLFARENLPSLVNKVEHAVVVVLSYDKTGNITSKGTGFFINEHGDVITNKHLLKGANSIKIKTKSGELYDVNKKLIHHEKSDLVRIPVNIPRHKVRYMPFSQALPQIGERIIVIGNPLGLELTVTDGIVSAIRTVPEYGKTIQITAPISEGSSGSPVVNTQGEVIGVATFQFVKGQNLNFAIPVENISVTPLQNSSNGYNDYNMSIKELYDAGLNYIWDEDYASALHYFKKIMCKNVNNHDALFQMGYCNNKLGNFSDAIAAFTRATKMQPENDEAYYNLGVVYGELENFHKAVAAYLVTIDLNPFNIKAHYNLGVCYNKLKKYHDAVKMFKRTIDIDSDFVEAYFGLGIAYGHLNDTENSITAFKNVVQLKPDHIDAYLGLGLIYQELRNNREAIEAYKKVIRIQPDHPEAHFQIGVNFIALNDNRYALQEYKILKQFDPDLADKLFELIY